MQNFMKTILSAVQTWTKGKIKESTADWNENDSSKDSYVKGRTHYDSRVTTKHSITFDGSLDGKEILQIGEEEYLVKVSDNPVKSSKLVGGTISIFGEGQFTITEDVIQSDGTVDIIDESAFIFYEDTAIPGGPTFTAGVWYFCIHVDGISPVYVSSVEWSETTGELKKLDKKYIPVVQADWNETNDSSSTYILNKPDIYTKAEIDAAKDYILLKETMCGESYKLQIVNGELTTSLVASLNDFTYAVNSDGTYAITGWNHTHLGEPSTMMIIPDDNNITL